MMAISVFTSLFIKIIRNIIRIFYLSVISVTKGKKSLVLFDKSSDKSRIYLIEVIHKIQVSI